MSSHLYHNLGGGKFTDVSESMGISARAGRAWGVVAADINGDGYPELFVANDLGAELSLGKPKRKEVLKNLDS